LGTNRAGGDLAKRIADKRLLKLIRAFLNAGVMENGLVSPSVEGTPQGGPLSPLLSNLVLDEFDRELECRGHRFVRYADDCNIYVRSERAGDACNAALVVPLIEGEAQRVDTVDRGFVDVGCEDFRDMSGERHGVVNFIVAGARGLDGPGIRGVESRPEFPLIARD
jgi:hypothetical protein